MENAFQTASKRFWYITSVSGHESGAKQYSGDGALCVGGGSPL